MEEWRGALETGWVGTYPARSCLSPALGSLEEPDWGGGEGVVLWYVFLDGSCPNNPEPFKK